MFIIINIGLVLLTTLFFVTSFFFIEKIKTFEYIIVLRIKKLILEFITGIVYSGLFVLFQIIMEKISDRFDVQIFLMGFVILTIILNYRVAIFSFPLAFIYFLLTNDIDAITYAQVISFFIMSIASLIIQSFIKNRGKKLILYGVGFVIGLITFLIMGTVYNKGLVISTFSTTLLPMMLFPIIDYSIMYVIGFSVEANILYESVNFSFGKFFRETIKEKEIGNVITEKKISQGIYAIIMIDFKIDSSHMKKEILHSVLTDIQESVPKDTVLFHNGNKSYGFFIPSKIKQKIKYSIENNSLIKRPDDDPLRELEKYISKYSKKYHASNGSTTQVQIFAGISIYGIQSNSLFQLNRNAEFALKLNRKIIENRISIFDPLLFRTKVVDSYDVKTLDRIIGLDNFVNRFTPIVNIETKEIAYQYVHQLNISETEFDGGVGEYIRDLGMDSKFQRYYANDALRKAGNTNDLLIVNYSINLFKPGFSIREFLRQLEFMKINNNKLILLSDYNLVNSLEDLKEIKKTMNILRKKGIKFAINSFVDTKIKFDLFVIPSSQISSSTIIETPSKIIVSDIKTKDKMIQMIEKGIKFVGGSVLQININLMKLNKQSRIYIEELNRKWGNSD